MPQDLGFTVLHYITTLFPNIKEMETNETGCLPNLPNRVSVVPCIELILKTTGSSAKSGAGRRT